MRVKKSKFIFFAALLIVQVLRVFHGLDFNDEMQYVGEMKSIIESGKLFQADLYFQQIIYLFVYPILKNFIKEDMFGLVLQLRLVLALFIFIVYFEVSKNLKSFSLKNSQSSFIALCSTFAIPIGNIYSISYNTISMGLLALIFSEFLIFDLNPSTKKIIKLSFITVILLVIYPTLGIVVGALICARFIFKRMYEILLKYVVVGTVFSVSFLIVLFSFTTFQDLKESLIFTSSFGVGQNIFYSSRSYFLFYFAFYSTLIFLMFIKWKTINKNFKDLPKNLHSVFYSLILILIFGFSCLSYLVLRETYSIKPLFVPLIALATFVVTILTLKKADLERNAWNIAMFLFACGIVSFTSSNGLPQFQWPAMLAPIFSLSFLLKNEEYLPSLGFKKISIQMVLSASVFILYIFLFVNYPYRDQKLWNQNNHSNIPRGIRGINISSEKLNALLSIREILKDVRSDSKLMIIGAHPWIYLATSSQIDTDMIFMHNTGSNIAYAILAKRMINRRPDFIIFTSEINKEILKSTDMIMKNHYTCTLRKTGEAFKNATETIKTFYPIFDEIKVCKKWGEGAGFTK